MNNCKVFTPDYIVNIMLDEIGYLNDDIRTKTILEPSFGEGAFLISIIKRILDYSKKKNLPNHEICKILDNVYGVEIDRDLYNKTIKNLNEIIFNYGITYDWKNLICGNSLHYNPNVLFDLCITNPPYTKIHHLDMETRKEVSKNYKFAGGSTDLYIVFFELCLKLLSPEGKLCFITPNSYFRNTSQKMFREHLAKNNLVKSIIDFSNVKVFNNIGTYTVITLLDSQKQDRDFTYTLMKNEEKVEFKTIFNNDILNSEQWTFATESDTIFLKNILQRKTKLKDLCEIQHGIATNADKIYIVETENFTLFEKDILRPVVKASTLDSSKKIIFPYKWNNTTQKYEIIDETAFKTLFPKTYKYLSDNKEYLLKRDMEANSSHWYQYARSQGIQKSNNKKIVLKHIISPFNKICEFEEFDEKTLVYSGIYIIVKDPRNYNLVRKIISSEEFHKYLFLVGKNMSGGYKNVSAKFVKEYGVDIFDY